MDLFASLFGGGILGSIVGGLFRLAPELLKALDKKDERAHELLMFERQVELEKARGQMKLDEIGAQRALAIDGGAMDAFKAALQQQTELAAKAGGFALWLSALIRPLITATLWAIYMAGMATIVALAVRDALPVKDIVAVVLNPDFMALLSGVTNYWFLDRTLAKRGLA